MRSLAILLLVALSCFAVEALKKRQVEEDHAGYCPIHEMICNIYCPPVSDDALPSEVINGCRGDNGCASDEKCCKPACGCTNKCVKALEKPGFDKSS